MSKSFEIDELCGYRPNPEATRKYDSGLRFPHFRTSFPKLMNQASKRDLNFLDDIVYVFPEWKRTKQTIGDCVSHGGTICADALAAQLARLGLALWIAPAASESLYGLRVEADNQASWSDGWFGSGQAKALNEYGVIPRGDYSHITGNPEHNLLEYSGKKAKDWGYYGNGGKKDEGKLDAIAKMRPIQEVTKVTTTEEAWAAIDAGCPISICSDAGFETGDGVNGIITKRDANGVSRRAGSWAHCMAIIGIRWISDSPQFRIVNSWGRSVGGPDPGITHEEISGSSWWVTEKDAAYILRQDDSYAFSRIAGFDLPPYDFNRNILV